MKLPRAETDHVHDSVSAHMHDHDRQPHAAGRGARPLQQLRTPRNRRRAAEPAAEGFRKRPRHTSIFVGGDRGQYMPLGGRDRAGLYAGSTIIIQLRKRQPQTNIHHHDGVMAMRVGLRSRSGVAGSGRRRPAWAI